MSSWPRFATAILLTCASLSASSLPLRAQVVVREDFEGPDISWREGRGNGGFRRIRHQRTADGPHGGAGCEFFEFFAGDNGTFLYLQHEMAPARVIAELQPSLWVRSDRTGVQLLAHVVFPRSIDPKTGQPDSVLVAGTSYTRANAWEQLRIEQLPELVAAQARVVRADTKRQVDTREAYVDRVVLNIFFAGAGGTRLWIDDLEMAGHVPHTAQARPAGEAVPTGPGSPVPTPRGELTSARTAPPAPRAGPRLNGEILLVGGRPHFPRAIEYQGEPLTFLKQRGFNCVRLRGLPSSELLAEAAASGMWLICAPPLPPGLSAPQADMAPLAEIPPEFSCVLAWDLGEGLTGRELPAVKRWAEQVRRADRLSRPILCGASADLHKYSAPAVADVLLLDRFIPSTTFELNAYRKWLRERPRFARYGTPIWSTIPTEPATTLVEQLTALSGGRPVDVLTGSEQMRLIAYTALGAGARALIFASHTPLTAPDAATRWRAAQLELLNQEFDLLEPWIAGGKLTAAATSSDTEVVASVFQDGGAYLVVPVWSGSGAQYVPGHMTSAGELTLVVPGVPETVSAYEVWPGGMRALPTPFRGTGGLKVRVDDFGLTSMILLTQDLAGDMLRRTVGARETAARAAELTVDSARIKLQLDSAVRGRLTGKEKALARGDDLLQSANRELQEANAALAVGRSSDAYRRAQFALRNLRAMERGYWQAAIAGLPSPVGSPFAVNFVTLPQHFALVKNVDGARRGANLLPEGDFEVIARVINAGWKHYIHPQIDAGVRAEDAKPSSTKKFEGKYSLRLAAMSSDPQTPPDQVETPPAWIITRELDVEPGTLLRLHARVLAAGPIKGSPDGLLIIDSLGGEALAERINQAPGWKEYTAYRVAYGARPLSITFALTGLGEVWIDEVSVEAVEPRDGSYGAAGAATGPSASRAWPFAR